MRHVLLSVNPARNRVLFVMVALMLLMSSVIQAQEATPQSGASISFDDGVVTEITAEGVVVNGLTILIAPGILDDDAEPIVVGTVLDVDGVLRPDGTVVAVSIDLDDDDDDSTPTPSLTPSVDVTATPTALDATPEVTPTEPANDDDFIIVIEGPVQQLNVNVITIYNVNITIERDAPALTVIQIGDVVRVEGILPHGDDDDDDDNRFELPNTVILAVNITFISVEVIIVDGLIWRDSGDCSNAPPVIIQERGGGTEWLIRCNQRQDNNNGNRGGGRNGGGGDNDDDDDDDDD
jgi:hypothetical protein